MSKNKLFILFALIYFAQGIQGLIGQPLEYLFKTKFGLSVQQICFFLAITSIAWWIKPLLGLISDLFPLFSYRRKSYLILNYLITISLLLFITIFGINLTTGLIVFISIGFCFAFSDVLCDGIMIVEGQKYKITGEAQSFQWGSISIASLIVGLSGGYIAQYLNYKVASSIIIVFLACILLYIIFQYKEEKTINYNKKEIWTRFKTNFKLLIKNKQLWIAIFFLFWLWLAPSFSLALRYKMRDILHFNELFIGLLGTLSSGLGILGAIIYWKVCKKFDLKKLLIIDILFSSISTLAYLYYPSWQIAILYSLLFSSTSMIGHLIILDFAARITPKNIEAFSFALICSVLNIGNASSELFGGWLYSLTNLNIVIVVASLWGLSSLILIPFISLKTIDK